ncbi:30S ribosomal protein S2 [Candidatus Giovannonibacteria bacterium]|nr:30S ribosomal protein S2 [Candidatus Giovannonibacteria bacterium]
MNTTALNSEIEVLFKAGAHIGYGKERRHPKMKPFIFGVRNNIEIFDLEKTLAKLKESEEFVKSLGAGGKIVLFVGTKPASSSQIESVGKRLGMPYVSERWLGGTITNFKVIESRLIYLDGLEREANSGELEKYVKKERLDKMAEIRKLSRMLGGIRSLKRLPDAIFIVDPMEEKTAFSEARRKNLPIVALLNTDCNPEGISHPIPANDNSAAVVSIVLERIAAAYEKGKNEKAAASTQ